MTLWNSSTSTFSVRLARFSFTTWALKQWPNCVASYPNGKASSLMVTRVMLPTVHSLARGKNWMNQTINYYTQEGIQKYLSIFQVFKSSALDFFLTLFTVYDWTISLHQTLNWTHWTVLSYHQWFITTFTVHLPPLLVRSPCMSCLNSLFIFLFWVFLRLRLLRNFFKKFRWVLC